VLAARQAHAVERCAAVGPPVDLDAYGDL
jgi:hypothetical protein